APPVSTNRGGIVNLELIRGPGRGLRLVGSLEDSAGAVAPYFSDDFGATWTMSHLATRGVQFGPRLTIRSLGGPSLIEAGPVLSSISLSAFACSSDFGASWAPC